MLYLEKPDNYNPKIKVAGCFVERNGKILMLLRNDSDNHGNAWSSPAGKFEEGETPTQAILRELKEETGYGADESKLEMLHKTYVKYPDIDFDYYIFRLKINEDIKVTLAPGEHSDFKWVTPEEALKMNLIRDEDACIKLVYKL